MSCAYSDGRGMIWGDENRSWVAEPSLYILMLGGRTITGLSGAISHICASSCSYSGGGIGLGECPFRVDTWLVSGRKMIFLGSDILVMKLEGLNWVLVTLIIVTPFGGW